MKEIAKIVQGEVPKHYGYTCSLFPGRPPPSLQVALSYCIPKGLQLSVRVRPMKIALQCIQESAEESISYICRYVSSQWLRQWADSLQPIPMDNNLILCHHGKLDPQKLKGKPSLGHSLDLEEGISLPFCEADYKTCKHSFTVVIHSTGIALSIFKVPSGSLVYTNVAIAETPFLTSSNSLAMI